MTRPTPGRRARPKIHASVAIGERSSSKITATTIRIHTTSARTSDGQWSATSIYDHHYTLRDALGSEVSPNAPFVGGKAQLMTALMTARALRETRSRAQLTLAAWSPRSVIARALLR